MHAHFLKALLQRLENLAIPGLVLLACLGLGISLLPASWGDSGLPGGLDITPPDRLHGLLVSAILLLVTSALLSRKRPYRLASRNRPAAPGSTDIAFRTSTSDSSGSGSTTQPEGASATEIGELTAFAEKMARGEFGTPLPVERQTPGLRALAEAIEQIREVNAEHHRDLERIVAAALRGDLGIRPNPAQAGSFGEAAMLLDRLLSAWQESNELIGRLSDAAVNGDFEARLPNAALHRSPAVAATRRLIAAFDSACADIGRVAEALSRGDLTERIEHLPPGRIGEVCRALDTTTLNLRETLGRIDAVVETIAEEARNIAKGNQSLAARTQAQAASLEETSSSMEEINAVVQQNALSAQQVSVLVDEASAMAESGSQTMLDAGRSISELSSSAQRIGDIVGVIDSLSFQTNILALNAAVEAARAGKHGQGFAVVAAEVRRLALSSSDAARDIRQLIEHSSRQTTDSVAQVNNLGNVMNEIATTVRRIKTNMHDIRSATQEQATGLGQVSQAVTNIDDATQQTSAQVEESAMSTRQLYGQSRGLHHLLAEFQLGEAGQRARAIHRAMPALVHKGAEAIGQAWETAIARGQISLDELFDEDYRPIGDSEPAKYATCFDSLADQLLPAIQEPLLSAGAHLAYAIACDRNGYVPTHNRRYCQPLTGDPERDRLGNRTKRLFSDPVGQRCGKHPLPYLLQTYRRDTGEIMHDISAPIYVQGRHWGGFRIGYKTVEAGQ